VSARVAQSRDRVVRSKDRFAQAWDRLDPAVAAAATSWIVARVLVGVGTLFARVITSKAGPNSALGKHPGWEFAWQFRHGWLGWVSWDGAWYRQIAAHGYGPTGPQGLRFFPLYPILGRGLSYPLAGNIDLSLLVIANVSAFIAAFFMYRLVIFETGDAHKATLAVWLFALFPAAFVLAWAYAEPLYLLTVIGGFLALRRHRWWWAAVAGLAAGLIRPVGFLLVIPAVIEVVRVAGRDWRRVTVDQVASILAPVAGLVAYLAWAKAEYNNWTLPFTVQETLRGKTVNPFGRVIKGLTQLVGPEGLKQGLHVPFVIAFIILIIVVFWRWPVSYGLFAAAVVLVSLTAPNINSIERYGLDAFPLILGLVVICFDVVIERAVLTISAGALVALTGLALVGVYVP
jgi:hypothetical protein